MDEENFRSYLDQRVVQILAKGLRVLCWIRHSDPTQAETADGSRQDQLRQVEYLRPYGVTEASPQLEIIFAAGETASRSERREFFEFELMERIESGEFGILIVAEADRIARNMIDGTRFVTACKRHRLLILVHGVLLDAQNHEDEYRLYDLFVEASKENARRNERLMRNRAQKASVGRLRVGLPTGLTYATPEDPYYRARLKQMSKDLGDASMMEWISEQALSTHKVVTTRDGRPYYVFFYPDAEVYTCTRLSIEWMLECGNLREVIRRIQEGFGDWPSGREGVVPVIYHKVFRHTNELRWRKATKQRLRFWLRSPALFGVYSFHAREYENQTKPNHVPTKTFASNAFPSFATITERETVLQLLTNPKRRRKTPAQAVYRGARNQALAYIICTYPLEDGKPCGRRFGAQYHADGTYRYMCNHGGTECSHIFSLSPATEDLLLETVLSALSPDRLREAVDAVRISGELHRMATADLERRRDAAVEEARAARHLAVKQEALVLRLNDQENVWARQEKEEYEAIARRKGNEARELDAQITRAAKEAADVTALVSTDVARLINLAGNLERLIGEARLVDELVDARLAACPIEERLRWEAHEGSVRKVFQALGIRVEARPLESASAEVVVVFPRGARVKRVIDLQYDRGSQFERCWLHHQVFTLGRDPADVASSIRPLHQPAGHDKEGVWTKSAVLAAATAHEHTPKTEAWGARGLTVGEVAELTGESDASILSAALRGQLGRGCVGRGCVLVEATEEQLHGAFAEYARRCVARAQGWDADDTIAIAQMASERGLRHSQVYDAALSWDSFARDASGRVFCLASRTPITEGEVIDQLLLRQPKHIQALDRQYWISQLEAEKLLSLSGRTIARETVSISQSRHARTFLWISPEIQASLKRVSLEEAVGTLAAELGVPLEAADFVPREHARRTLHGRFGGFSKKPYYRLLASGSLLEVRAAHPRPQSQQKFYVWAPDYVLNAEDDQVVRAWADGELLPSSNPLREERSTERREAQ